MKTERHAKVSKFLSEPMSKDVALRIERVAFSLDVAYIAVMPDVHLAAEYCVGSVVATRSRIYPHAIGGDIGCGMLAMRLADDAADVIQPRVAGKLFALLKKFVPANRHSAETAPSALPECLADVPLSDPRLEKLKRRDGRVQLGTLGRGNHFLELQSDVGGALWIMLHSGSRAMGQAITAHHLRHALHDDVMPYLLAESGPGRAYLRDLAWAAQYARQNRLSMLRMATEALRLLCDVVEDDSSLIESDHNHLSRERHHGEELWVHRKGAQNAQVGALGVIPGSMGTTSYHVVGRGNAKSLMSSSHGAGRKCSRSEARGRISVRDFRRQMGGVIFDDRKAGTLRDEAPQAYKDIRRVMQAQRTCVRIVRELRPMLSYKA